MTKELSGDRAKLKHYNCEGNGLFGVKCVSQQFQDGIFEGKQISRRRWKHPEPGYALWDYQILVWVARKCPLLVKIGFSLVGDTSPEPAWPLELSLIFFSLLWGRFLWSQEQLGTSRCFSHLSRCPPAPPSSFSSSNFNCCRKEE